MTDFKNGIPPVPPVSSVGSPPPRSADSAPSKPPSAQKKIGEETPEDAATIEIKNQPEAPHAAVTRSYTQLAKLVQPDRKKMPDKTTLASVLKALEEETNKGKTP